MVFKLDSLVPTQLTTYLIKPPFHFLNLCLYVCKRNTFIRILLETFYIACLVLYSSSYNQSLEAHLAEPRGSVSCEVYWLKTTGIGTSSGLLCGR
jgi:hypothetical protein